MAKKKKIEKLTISQNDLLLRSPGKLSSADPKVTRGCGYHKSEKDYSRKKTKQKLQKMLADYPRSIKSLMLAG